MKKRIALPASAFVVVLAGCAYSFYWVLFFTWMTAYHQNDYHLWRTKLYIWLAVFIVLGIVDAYSLYWMIARIKKFKTSVQKL